MNFADEYRKNIAEDRRDSLSFRNAEGKSKRDFQAEVNADECHRVHESYELKWAGKRDADEDRKKVARYQGISLLSAMQKASVFMPSRLKSMLMSVREHMRSTG